MDLLAPAINRLLQGFLDEDLGRGDLTNEAFTGSWGSAYWLAKEPGVFCGGPLITRLFQQLDSSVSIRLLVSDGDRFDSGQRLLELQGSASALLAGERTGLNLAMRLSGISTSTAYLVEQLVGTGVLLADTRKTTPGLRVLEKYAVRCGGGVNHRLGLDDAAMLKENHIAWAGGIEPAVRAVRASAPWTSRVIVEAETTEQAEEAVRVGADGVLLDNFPPIVLKKLVPNLRELALRGAKHRALGRVYLEASGVEVNALKEYANTGIDLISISAPITRSKWLDFSMRFEKVIDQG